MGGEAVTYLLDLVEGVGGYTWLEPLTTCTNVVLVETLIMGG